MIKKQQKLKAFTLIELLVVIAIIGILSSIVLASLSGARESAKVTRTVSDFQQVETAMTMWMTATGRTEWPDGDGFSGSGGSSQVDIRDIMNETSLSKYLNNAPTPAVGSESYGFHYRNYDGTNHFSCGSPTYYGVNIYLDNVSQEIGEQVNSIIDGDNESNPLGCGKLRWRSSWGGRLIYGLSDTDSF